MTSVDAISQTQKVVVNPSTASATVISLLNKVVMNPDGASVKMNTPVVQNVVVNSSDNSIHILSQTQRIVVNAAARSAAVFNAGPIGPTGATGPSWTASVLDADGSLLTRVAGVVAPVTRAALAADPAFAAVITPTGCMMMYAAASAPSGWLFCNGSLVSRTTYATLFGVIGETYGAGDGSSTFAIPDMRGRTPIGVGAGTALTNRVLAVMVGEEAHTLTSSESGVPAHSHANTAVTAATSHGHTGSSADTEAAHTHGAGSFVARRSSYSGTNGNAGRASSAVNQGTLVDDITVTGTSGTGGSHTHVITIANESAHTHAVTMTNVNNTAANAASSHNNMQPSLVVNFIIKT
jgi:microcystin-dependent protein